MPIMARGTQSNTQEVSESGQNLTFPMGGTKTRGNERKGGDEWRIGEERRYSDRRKRHSRERCK